MPDQNRLTSDQLHADAQATTRRTASVTLASVWSRPDFRAAAISGQVPITASILYMVIYDNLRSSAPSQEPSELSLPPEFWTSQYVRGISFIRSAWECRQIQSLESLELALSRFMDGGCFSDQERRYATAAIAKGRIQAGISPLVLPPHLVMRLSSIEAMGWPTDMEIPDSAKVGVVKVDASNPKPGFKNGYYPVLASYGSNRLIPLKGAPSTTHKAAARDAVQEQYNLNYRNQARAGSPTLEFTRLGEDWRKGVPVSVAVLAAVFSFKGLEFGRSVLVHEQQSFMDALFDASMDLCSIIEMPLKAASCYGRLGIAFGSQGRGASTGSAHFDAETWQMHLTKTRGGGALCHEFGHAFDAMLLDALFDRSKLPEGFQFLSDVMASYHDPAGIYAMSDSLVPLLLSPYYKRALLVMDDICENIFSRRREDSYFSRSDAIDHNEGVVYLSQPRELFARAFETFALDKLKAQGFHNEFLVKHVDDFRSESSDNSSSIFPQGFQRRELSQLFSRLLVELRDVDLMAGEDD